MSNIKYDWEKILKDSAHVMAQCIKNGKYISNIIELYYEMESYYKKKGKAYPCLNTYRQNIGKMLNSSEKGISVKTALYQLAAKYDEMTLSMLAESIAVATDETADNCYWLFIRLKKYEYDYVHVQKHLYFLSHELKKKFSNEIVFISYDIDTLVIMCSNAKARKRLFNFFTSKRINASLL